MKIIQSFGSENPYLFVRYNYHTQIQKYTRPNCRAAEQAERERERKGARERPKGSAESHLNDFSCFDSRHISNAVRSLQPRRL